MKVLGFLAVSFFAIFGMAHTLNTASGVSVFHQHPLTSSSCVGDICPVKTDTQIESIYGFSSTEKIYPKTSFWNCHGRTFAAKSAFVDWADPWVNNEGPMTPASPKIGDPIIWFKDGKTYHSATIVSTWDGTRTLVMSKYGVYGQYKHTLAKCISAYAGTGVTWGVARFPSSTVITRTKGKNLGDLDWVSNFIDENKRAPWREQMISDELVAEARGREIVESMTKLRDSTIYALEENPGQDNTKALIDDLITDSHYGFVGMSLPEFTDHYITGFAASEMLIELANENNTNRKNIINSILGLLGKGDLGNDTGAKNGVLLFTLGQILSEEERVEVKEYLQKVLPLELRTDQSFRSYTELYFEQL